MLGQLHYFPTSFVISRNRFLETIRALPYAKELGQWQVPGRQDNDLTVDYAYLPPTERCSRLFVIISGVHGPEGFLGSAIQHLFLKEILPGLNLKQTGFLLVHALNPFGFKHLIRCTENGINLNRNCSIHPQLFEARNRFGVQMSQRFIPVGPVTSLHSRILDNCRIEGQTVHFANDVSLDQFIKAVGPGQHEVPEALEFGGFSLEPQIKQLAQKLNELMPKYSDVIAFDLHTGLGHRGRLHLLSDGGRSLHMALFKELLNPKVDNKIYEFTPSDTEGFYTVQGATNNLFAELGSNEQRVCALTMEFGTLGMDPQATVHSYNLWMLDHQGAIYGYASESLRQELETLRRERFCPSAPEWRNLVLQTSRDFLRQVLARTGALI